jgi:alkylhydroperoxidase family enzyme
MARISYVDVEALDDPELAGYLEDSRRFGTPRPESQSIRAHVPYAEAIAWDPALADDDLWARLHEHFTEPEIVELGYFIGVTMGQQCWLKTMQVQHGEVRTETTAGLAPGLTV